MAKSVKVEKIPAEVAEPFTEACAACPALDAETKQVVFQDGERIVYHRHCLPREFWVETHGFPAIDFG